MGTVWLQLRLTNSAGLLHQWKKKATEEWIVFEDFINQWNLTKVNSLKAKNITHKVHDRDILYMFEYFQLQNLSEALSYLTGGSGGVFPACWAPLSATTELLENV